MKQVAANTLHFPHNQNGNIDIVKMLLDAGHSPNEANVEGLTPLHIAVQMGQADIVTLLAGKINENKSIGHFKKSATQHRKYIPRSRLEFFDMALSLLALSLFCVNIFSSSFVFA